MQIEKIPVQVSSVSCVGYMNSVFPRGYGNYISTYNNNTSTLYQIVNLSYEDLNDAINNGIIDTDTIEANVYGSFESTDWNNNPITIKVAYITDSRFPEICLIPEWWYDKRNVFRNEILRKKYQVPEGVCLCEFEDSQKSAIFYSSMSYAIDGYVDSTGICTECKKLHRIVRKRP